MEAATLNCPMCGASARSDAPTCGHCGARLATVACPSCFGMIFRGAKFCQHCGAKVDRVEMDTAPHPCPRCKDPLTTIALGATRAMECARCMGLWIDTATFNEICLDREQQADVVRESLPPLPPNLPDYSLDSVRYVPCPVCTKLMNRINFAHGSGVIVDICKNDGVWFDRDELRRIVDFIRAGGLEVSRARDREAWQAEKRKRPSILPSEKAGAGGGGGFGSPALDPTDLLDAGGSSLLGDALHFVARVFLK